VSSHLPYAPLLSRPVTSAVAAIVGVVVGALAVQAFVPLGPWFPLKAGIGLVAGLLVLLPGLRRHHPFPRFGAANQVTLARAGLLALLGALVGEPATIDAAVWAVGLASLAIALDGIDGRLARRQHMTSAFGARFDMEVDALLVLVLSVLVWLFGKAGAWVLLSGLLRYTFVAVGTVVPWLRQPLPPRRHRQVICIVQLIALTAALTPFIRPPFSAAIAVTALFALILSFAVDIRWLARNHHPV
jgi:phosphatidylglycerophosphate synthase